MRKLKQQDLSPRKGAARAGLSVLRRRIEIQGLACIDKRTAGAQQLLYWRQQLLESLGGEADLSAQKKTLVELAVRARLLLEHADAFILSLPSCVNRRKKTLLPIVMQRTQLAEALQKTLDRLGLERQAKKIPTLAEYLAEKEAAAAEPIQAEAVEPEKSDDQT